MNSATFNPEIVADVIRDRRTIHLFQPHPPPLESIHDALEAACWAPNHHRTEPWRFHLLGPRTVEQVVELNTQLVREAKGDAAAEAKRQRWSSVPGWVAVTCAESADLDRRLEDYAACCCAIQNFSLLLWSRGIGSKWSTGAVTRHETFYDLLEVNRASRFVVGLMWYGFPEQVPEQQRRPLAEVLHTLP